MSILHNGVEFMFKLVSFAGHHANIIGSSALTSEMYSFASAMVDRGQKG